MSLILRLLRRSLIPVPYIKIWYFGQFHGCIFGASLNLECSQIRRGKQANAMEWQKLEVEIRELRCEKKRHRSGCAIANRAGRRRCNTCNRDGGKLGR